MNKLQKCMKAFAIFNQFGECDLAAEHDIIYAGPEPDKVDEDTIKLLEELGWHPCSEFECFSTWT